MSGITVWTDENGVTREYREVKRIAQVGELVKVTSVDDGMDVFYGIGDVGTVTRSDITCVKTTLTNGCGWVGHTDDDDNRYVVLEPTDVIHHNSKRYREVKRLAKVGELIKINDANAFGSNYKKEDIIVVRDFDRHDGSVSDGRRGGWLWEKQYTVLEPIDDESTQPTPSLEQRVTHLENMLRDVQQQLATIVPAQPITVSESTQRTYTRDEVVELAKADVERLRVECFDLRFVDNDATSMHLQYLVIHIKREWWLFDGEYGYDNHAR